MNFEQASAKLHGVEVDTNNRDIYMPAIQGIPVWLVKRSRIPSQLSLDDVAVMTPLALQTMLSFAGAGMILFVCASS